MALKGLTERQIRRREDILAAARKLLTKHGVDGVTMRNLAKESGVAPKTLYHQFGSKEKLLRTAVEERFRYYYRMIDEEDISHGIDRLFFIIDTVAATTQKNKAYARALSPLVQNDPDQAFLAIRTRTYSKAVRQIADEGGFLPWVNIDLIEAIIVRQMRPVYLVSWLAKGSWDLVAQVAKLEISLILDSVTQGYTHKKASATIKALHKELKQFGENWQRDMGAV